MCDCNKNILYYDIVSSQQISKNGNLEIFPYCNGITFFNTGTATATINGIPLVTNASMSFGGNKGEIFQGRVTISFGAGVPLLLIQQKVYTRNPEL